MSSTSVLLHGEPPITTRIRCRVQRDELNGNVIAYPENVALSPFLVDDGIEIQGDEFDLSIPLSGEGSELGMAFLASLAKFGKIGKIGNLPKLGNLTKQFGNVAKQFNPTKQFGNITKQLNQTGKQFGNVAKQFNPTKQFGNVAKQLNQTGKQFQSSLSNARKEFNQTVKQLQSPLDNAGKQFSQTEQPQPEYSEPEYSEPEYSEPEYSEPEYSEPEYSEPEYSEPDSEIVEMNGEYYLVPNSTKEQLLSGELGKGFFDSILKLPKQMINAPSSGLSRVVKSGSGLVKTAGSVANQNKSLIAAGASAYTGNPAFVNAVQKSAELEKQSKPPASAIPKNDNTTLYLVGGGLALALVAVISMKGKK
jgi:hypothetical protein